ncbi:MAG: hypothetical protein OXC40_01170, partial [Proteobacteria bacterium]|nr:hypothetical protein [Pseudomonadota bacterium]
MRGTSKQVIIFPMIVAILSFTILASPSLAENQEPLPPVPLPEINNVENTNIYLITVGLGPSLHARYGDSNHSDRHMALCFIGALITNSIPWSYRLDLDNMGFPLDDR